MSGGPDDAGGLAIRRDPPSAKRARTRVEGQPTESVRGSAQVDGPMSRTRPDETGAVRGRTVTLTGSDGQQHADHPTSASECASVGSEIPRTSHTIVVQGREWS
jgi:hypothetical protein